MKQTQAPVQQPLTPLEKLQAEKKRLKQQSLREEEALAADFQYIQENAVSLLIAGISALLFPGSKSSKTTPAQQPTEATVARESQPMGLSGYLSIAGSLVPVAWGIVQPILVSLAVKQVKRWATRLFSKRKK